jgi:hypothetical protein
LSARHPLAATISKATKKKPPNKAKRTPIFILASFITFPFKQELKTIQDQGTVMPWS